MKKQLTIIVSLLLMLILLPISIISNEVEANDEYGGLCFTANTAGSTIALTKNGSPSWTGYYSTNGTTWNAYTPSTTGAITLTNAGDKVYFKGTYSAYNTTSKYLKFIMTGSIAASGNIMSFCSGDKYASATTIPYSHVFYKLFYGCTSLTTAPQLPATTLATNCYQYMFYGCTSLTQAPKLPATKLFTNCYQYMFYGCTSLTQAPSLPATTLAQCCYQYMFYGCTSLTQTPELPATTLDAYCYQYMFYGCTSLTQAPSLPATTLATECYKYMFGECTNLAMSPELPAGKDSIGSLAQYCYQYMFYGCTSLTQAPSLPSTTLAYGCYYGMFKDCTSLTTAPSLPATTLASSCYYWMFSGCTSLITAPSLPATTLTTGCYYSMFENCTSLTSIPELPAPTLASSCYREMFKGCSNILLSTTKTDKYTEAYTIQSSIPSSADYCLSFMFSNTGGTFRDTPNVNTTYYLCLEPNYLTFTANTAGSTVTPKFDSGSYEYSIDGGNTWKAGSNSGTEITLTDVGGTVMLRGTDCVTNSTNHFSMVGSISTSGDVTSLTNDVGGDAILSNDCYASMFSDCTSLQTVPTLSATSLNEGCYSYMFSGCTGITQAPTLPATTLAKSCYSYMFENCTSLTTASTLQETTLPDQCYEGMFSGCSNIKLLKTNPGYTVPKTYSIPSVGTPGTNCLLNMFSGAGGDIPTTPTINTTYYYQKNSQTLSFEKDAITKTYGESAFTNTLTHEPTTISVAFKSSDESVATVNSNGEVTILKAGTTTIKATAAEDETYASATATYELTVNKADVTLTTISATEITYGKTLGDSTLLGTAEFKGATVAGTWSWKDSSTKPTVVNSETTPYDVTFTPTDTTNFNVANGKVKIKVNQKQLEISGTTVNDKTYDGNTNGTATPGTLSGVETGDVGKVTASASVTFGDKNVGTPKATTVTYSISGDASGNYLAPVTDTTITAKITPATITVTPDSDQKKTYDGSAPTSIAYSSKGAITGETADFSGSLGFDGDAIDAGEYNIIQNTLVLKDNDSFKVSNYSLSFTSGVKYTINKAKVDVPTAITTLVYNKTEQTGVVLPSEAKYTLKDNTGTNAGDYTATASLNVPKNYEWNISTPTSDDQSIPWSIAPLQLTISGTSVDNKTYDGNTIGTATPGTLDGVIAGDIVTPKVTSATFNNKDVGTGISVTVVYELEGSSASNYKAPGNDTLTANITALQLSVTDSIASNKEYDGSNTATITVGTVTGIISEDDAEVSYSSAQFEDENVGTSKKVTVVYNVIGTDKDNYIAPETEDLTASITKKQLTVEGTTIDNKTYDGNTSTTPTMGNVKGIVGSEDVKVEINTALFEDANAGTGKKVTVTYNMSGTAIGNYLKPVDDSSLTANINQKQLSISTETGKTTTVKNKVYDGNKTGTIDNLGTLVGVIEGDIVTPKVTSATFADKDVGTGISVTVVYELEGSSASNYKAPGNDTLTANITKRNVTLTSATDSKKYEKDVPLTAPTVTVSGDGFVSGEGAEYTNFTSETGTELGITKVLNEFDYTLNAGTKVDNYKITVVNGSLTIIGTKKDSGDMDYDIKNGFTASYTVKQASIITAHIADKDTSYTVAISENDIDLTPETDYKVVPGSIKINFQTSYLNSLKVGTHKLLIKISKTGEDTIEYISTIVVKNSTPTPPPYKPVPTGTK